MALAICPSREKVLLNLKWFVHRVIKSFELKLVCAVGKTIHKSLRFGQSARHFEHMPPQSPLRHLKEPNNLGLPLLRQLLEHQLQQQSENFAHSRDNGRRSHENLEDTRSPYRVFNRSPLMRVRSLTNSPLFGRLSLPGVNGGQCQPLFSGEGNNLDSPTSSLANGSNRSIASKGSWTSNNEFSSSRSSRDSSKNRLLRLFDVTSESERRKSLSDFAEQLCVIYEYQLGMLRGLKAVHSAADYIAELVLKALRTGTISGLDCYELTPAILFESQTRPSSASKFIKTCPLNVTGEQLSWKLGDIWTHAGLRHNEVGGENCHNLSIVTHFLSPFTPFGEMRRPDVYGYRNLIVLPAGHISGAPREDVKLDAKESEDDSSSILSVNFTHRNFKSNDAQQLKGGTKPATYFDILPYDAATISRSRIRIGTKNDPLNEAASGNGLTDIRGPDTKDLTEISRTSIISSSPKNLQGALNSNISLRQHLHRAYRPVFFLIFDRPSVLEHLTECDSFAAFCKRQMISPVMFVNQPTDIFCGKAHPSLYHNFDLFQVTVSGYSFHPDGKNTQAVLDSLYPSNSWLNGSSDVDLCPDKNIRHKRLTAFDNPGFVR